jgi:hypothetical protein
VRLDPGSTEVDHLIKDSSKAIAASAWRPEVDFTVGHMMVDADVESGSRVPPAVLPSGISLKSQDFAARGRARAA